MKRRSLLAAAAVAVLLVAALAAGRAPLARWCAQRSAELHIKSEHDAAERYGRLAYRLAPESAGARIAEARRLQRDGDFDASQTLLGSVDEKILSDLEKIDGLTLWAVNALRMSRLDDARQRFEEALALARSTEDGNRELAVQVHLGRMSFYYTHQYKAARTHLEAATALAARTGQEVLGAEAGILLGQLLWWWEQEVDNPLPDYFEPALETFQRYGDRFNEADAIHKIAFFHGQDGNLLEFFKYQGRSIALREEIGDRVGLAHEYLTLGWAYLKLHDERRARRYLEKSLEVNADRGDLFAYLRSQRMLAECDLRQGFLDEAEDRIRSALDRAEPGEVPEHPFLWAQLAEVALQRGRPLEARRHFERALEIGERGTLGGANYVWMLAGLTETYTKTGALDRAEELLAQLEARVAGMSDSASIRRLELQRAALATAQGDSRTAFRALLEAEEVQLRSVATAPVASDTTSRTHERLLEMLLGAAVDPSRQRLLDAGPEAHAELAFDLLEQRSYGFYRDLVVLSVGRKRRDTQAASTALADLRASPGGESAGSATLSVAELREAYGGYEDLLLREALSSEGYRTIQRAKPLSIPEIRARLEPDSALLQYVLADGRAFCLVIRPSGLSVIVLPFERRVLPPKARLFRALALEPEESESAAWRPIAGDLHELLVRPIREAGLLADVRRLGIVPYGELHDIPFAALLDPATDRLLVEDFELFLLPTASLVRTPSSRVRPKGGVFAIGLEDAGAPDLEPLAFAAREARVAVAALGGTARLERDATETSFKRAGSAYRYLHLATHGVSEPRMPLLSHLVLRATADDDGRLTVGEIFELDVQAELVVLAGCRTGLSFSPDGGERSPVGRLGLIQAFLHSGAESVLASLAPVRDASTLAFMKGFYESLPNGTRSAALAETQRAMARGAAGATLRHPRHWAPFILVGTHP